jgi:hypothetical protein
LPPLSSQKYEASSFKGPVLKEVKIRNNLDLDAVQPWLKRNKMKNAKIKQILKQARKAIDNPEISEFNWMYPQDRVH